MSETTQFIVTKPTKYGWIPETQQSWIDLHIDNENTLRLTFSDEFPSELKLCLQVLQKHVTEERQKAGLPSIEHTSLEAVERLEYWRDDLNQIAGIRTRFQNGGSADVPIEKAQIQQTIEFLTDALQAFDSQQKSRKH